MRRLHLFLRDLVEHHAANRRGDGVPLGLREVLFHVPPDGLAFAIRVGRDEDLARALRDLLEVAQHVFLAFDRHVLRLEAVIDVDAKLLRGQIADVADRGAHRVVAPQVLADVSRLGRRLDDHERGAAFRRRPCELLVDLLCRTLSRSTRLCRLFCGLLRDRLLRRRLLDERGKCGRVRRAWRRGSIARRGDSRFLRGRLCRPGLSPSQPSPSQLLLLSFSRPSWPDPRWPS